MYKYNATVINVVDGDTFDLDVDLGFKIHYQIRVRLLDIDTPEKRSLDPEEKENGIVCTYIAERMWLNKEVIIQSFKEVDIDTDSFGRYLVYIEDKNGTTAVDAYNALGMNKKNASYNPILFKNYYRHIKSQD